MNERDGAGSARARQGEDAANDGLAAEVRASVMLIALVLVATLGVAILAHVLLRSGS